MNSFYNGVKTLGNPNHYTMVIGDLVFFESLAECSLSFTYVCVGETKRTLSQRFKEHTNLDKPTGVGDHCRATGHSVSMKNTKVLTRESNWHKRKVKEAIDIKHRAPTMNRNQGHHLPAIYNQIIPPKSEATHVTSVRDQGP